MTDTDNLLTQQKETNDASPDTKEDLVVQPVKEIHVHVDGHHRTHEGLMTNNMKIGPTTLCYLEPANVEDKIKSESGQINAITKAISQHSDLLARVYEGGLKIWECSIDLVNYLNEADVDFTDKTVIELGCGAGLPGILALKRGANRVIFQDYNEEVLEEMTVANVALNFPNDEKDQIKQKCQFLSGDWSLLEKFLKESGNYTKYDIILTSETIYSVESQPVLHDLLKALLSPAGVVYVAAKTHYFGVGGGTRMFEDLVKERGDFTIGVCKQYKQGRTILCQSLATGVQREILKMKLVQDEDKK